MKLQIQEIASRISFLREEAGLSIEELANNLNITKEQYVEYESGSVDFPISVLDDIAVIFGVELSTLITGVEPRLHIYSVTKKGKGFNSNRREEYNYEALASNFIHKNMEPFKVTVTPKGDDVDFALNSHTGREFELILEGSMQIKINDKVITLEEGDSIFFDSSYPHGMKAIGDKPCTFLAIIN